MASRLVRRVAILGCRGFPSTYGGFETAVREIAPIWQNQGLSVTVYCRDRKEGQLSWIHNGVCCRWTPGIDNKSASTLSFGLTSNLDAALRSYDAALILNVANGFFLPLLRMSGVGTALNTDGIEWERGKWGSAARQVFLAGARASARFADVLVSDSRAIGDIWSDTFGVETEFIPYGARVLEGIGERRVRDLGLEPGTYALVVARLIPENNVDLTLNALQTGSSVPAVIVGSANYNAPIVTRLRSLSPGSPIKWLGHVDDQDLLNELWANAGVYVHGHSVGGTNPALLQALGAGSPTVALDTVFNREVLGFEDQLYASDAHQLAAKIRAVLGDPVLRARWSARGREIVRERYDWHDIAYRYREALELAASRRQRT